MTVECATLKQVCFHIRAACAYLPAVERKFTVFESRNGVLVATWYEGDGSRVERDIRANRREYRQRLSATARESG